MSISYPVLFVFGATSLMFTLASPFRLLNPFSYDHQCTLSCRDATISELEEDKQRAEEDKRKAEEEKAKAEKEVALLKEAATEEEV